MKKRIAVLGSTGSIGTQTLEVVDAQKDIFEIEVLTANNNADLLIKQSLKYKPNSVVIANKEKYNYVSDALSNYPIKIYAGEESIAQIVQFDNIDIVLNALVGYSGLLPTIKAIEAGKNIALANKETLVVAGELINKLIKENKGSILPVDSEHSAIFQCLTGEINNPIEKIYITASGGPFREKDINFLKTATKKQALNHPNWDMGAKITIDSASMMNKGFEVIEAKWLFGLDIKQIDVVVHPQSIVHSIVQFEDGAMKAQMGLPDMKLPIQYALTYPERIKSNFPRFNFLDYPNLTFEKPDFNKFRNLAIAYEALEKGGNVACAINAANEIAVDAFLNDRIKFLDITSIIEKTIEKTYFIKNNSFKDYFETNSEAREIAKSLIK
ncbi:MAG: 1-deoxy-D-xylulose-5-phosphate reductoisomerase [Bacteroidetes bacterium]|nr:1-deoxy-D-xylulose-5-phosphate reductoisomerase [Bacteroidota bacterium]